MYNNDDMVRLRHMLDAAREALSFAQDKSREDLDSDRILVLALVKDVEIIGEAAYQISKTTREQLQDIPWEDISGMRHRLVHVYFDINLDVIWRTVHGELPDLVQQLLNVMGREP